MKRKFAVIAAILCLILLTPAAALAAREREVKLFPGTDIELNGRITLPDGADADTPFALLIHGSGPSDMDETVLANKPFRDIAQGLAENGVGSLRFDKISYARPEHPLATVEDEYTEPVREALRVLREETGARRVYAVGHSLGGILIPHLVEALGFDGGVSLSGTPQPLWQMSLEQNLQIIEGMPEEQRAPLLESVEAEREKGLRLKDLTEEEAAKLTVFTMDGVYLRSIDILDEIAIAKESGKPYLFVWGEGDLQVSRAAFSAWEEGLGRDGPYSYISYPGLSHLFTPVQTGDSLLNIMDAYSRAATTDPRVAKDIAAWIARQG